MAAGGGDMSFLADLAAWFVDNASGSGGWLWRTWEHVQVSVIAVIVGAVVAIPPAAWLAHKGRGGLLASSLVNIGRAVPSFGIIALALPITIRIANRVPFIDSGLGMFPTLVALIALALPPIFTNTYTGIRQVDPDTVEAARAMGIAEMRVLVDVELPMASPVVLAGIRTSAAQVVATATLGALVAYGGLGRFIVDGFAVRDDVTVVAGAVLVAALTIVVEGGFVLAERLMMPPPLRGAASSPGATRRAV